MERTYGEFGEFGRTTAWGQWTRKMRFVKLILFVGLVFAAFAAAEGVKANQKGKLEPIKVFIFTATNKDGFVDADVKRRADSVEDLKKALEKNSLIQLVSERDAADVVLEVLGRGAQETGSATSTRDIYGQWHTNNDTVATVRVALTAGSYSTVLEGWNNGSLTYVWRTAANNAAKHIENWIKANYGNIVSRREQSPTSATSELIASPEGQDCTQHPAQAKCRVLSAKAAGDFLRQTFADVVVTASDSDNMTMVVISPTIVNDKSYRTKFRAGMPSLEKSLCLFGFTKLELAESDSQNSKKDEYPCDSRMGSHRSARGDQFGRPQDTASESNYEHTYHLSYRARPGIGALMMPFVDFEARVRQFHLLVAEVCTYRAG